MLNLPPKNSNAVSRAVQEAIMQWDIVVNGQAVTVLKNDLTHSEVAAIAYPASVPQAWWKYLSCTYRRGGDALKTDGILGNNQSVRIKNGTVINICHTGSA